MTQSALPIRIAVLGTGDWGANHVRTFGNLAGVKLLALCDSNESRLHAAAQAYPGVRTYRDVQDLANDPDVEGVVVSASAVSHYSLASCLLNAGKDVLVEKPLTLSVSDGERLCRLAAENGRVLMVGHLLIHHPAVAYVKSMLDSGAMGDLLYIYCQRVNLGKVRSDENALWSLAPHDISVMLHLFGCEPIDVAARGSSFLQAGIEDVVFLDLRFPSGRLGHAHVSWLDPHKERRVTVVGTKKMVVFDDMQASEKIRIYDKGVDRGGEVVSFGEALTVRSGEIVIPRIPGDEPLRRECQHFVDSIRSRSQPTTDGLAGLQVVRVLDAAQRSLRGGGAPVALSSTGESGT